MLMQVGQTRSGELTGNGFELAIVCEIARAIWFR
jgi:hypothetical protein